MSPKYQKRKTDASDVLERDRNTLSKEGNLWIYDDKSGGWILGAAEELRNKIV